ncbi:MAG: PQQ-binding-like beta-propeller repeat protein [Planctomycetota bacterium]
MKRFLLVFTCWGSLVFTLSTCEASDRFPQFRGAAQDATSPGPLPTRWSASDGKGHGIRWKIDLKGEGWSQPVIWDDRVYLTAAVPLDADKADSSKPENYNGGYGRDRRDLVGVVYQYQVRCLDRRSGKTIWETVVKTDKPPIPRHTTNTYATETPATDGKYVYAYFGMNGLYCLDQEGEVVWKKDLGVFPMRADWGTASSIALLENRLFIQVDNDQQSFLTCIETATGSEVWRTNREERSQYSSPFVWKNSQRTEVILGGMFYRSYDPETGDLLWQIDMNKGRSSATPVAVGDKLFIGNEFRNRGGADDGGGRLYCITPGGSGDITPPNDGMQGPFVSWRMDDSGIQLASPVYCAGNLYFFQRRAGIVTCVSAATGEKRYVSRLRGARSFWASPWTDGTHVFALDSNGNTHVLQAGDELKVLPINEMDEMAWSTPAVAGGAIYLRTIDSLYCIGSASDSD